MDGQVRLAEATNRPHVFGIGAPDKLQGEILIAESRTWVAKLREGRVETRESDSPSESAVFLAVARVPRWTEITLDADVAAEDFDDFIHSTLAGAELAELETVPFVIEGRFPTLNLHVLNGQCPFAEVQTSLPGSGPPHRLELTDAQGTLVGFYGEHGAGRITHHWTRTHVHALVGPDNDRTAGHVDAAALKAGAIVRVPVLRGGAKNQKATPKRST
jgi:hypothetical protein